MFSFLPGLGFFAAAGAIAAAGPVIIHLLNRRRFRVVHWAAMDFLREAMQRNRRMLQWRDLILLLLRCLAVFLFGFALARPFFSKNSTGDDPNQPVHAILVVDNSLSMAYKRTDQTLLDDAKKRAVEYIDSLPDRSRISILPLCGSESGVSNDPYRTKEDAKAALRKIEIVDNKGPASSALEKAREAVKQAADMGSKRVVLLGDQQLLNWKGVTAKQFEGLPEVQVVDLAARDAENTWISDVTVQDGIADAETPTRFVATINHQGPSANPALQVTLSVDGADVQTSTIDMPGSQGKEIVSKQIAFSPYRFEHAPEPGKTNFVPVKVALPPDHLSLDDERNLVVPVVAAVPVVFVDQYGDQEDPKAGHYGETWPFRHFLVPKLAGEDPGHRLIQVRHVRIDQVDRKLLQDARLVVIAGVARPEQSVKVLQEYVRQGGQLIIAAGGDFDPVAWNDAAWLDGGGILPAKLQSTPFVATDGAKWFSLDYNTLSGGYFQLPEYSREGLSDLYHGVMVGKAIDVDLSQATLQKLAEHDQAAIEADRKTLAELADHEKSRKELAKQNKLDETARRQHEADDQQRAKIMPNWLTWKSGRPDDSADAPVETLVANEKPIVLGRYTAPSPTEKDVGIPFMIQRKIGQGETLFISTGMLPDWNTLAVVDAVLILDRLMRTKIEQTLPLRNLSAVSQWVLPIDSADRLAHFTLTRPDGRIEDLAVDALGADSYGVTVRNALQRGVYKVTAFRAESSGNEAADAKLWEVPLAVNGESEESELAAIDADGLKKQLAPAEGEPEAKYHWVEPGEAISLAGVQISSQNLWKWFAQFVLICLFIELAILAWPLKLSHLGMLLLFTVALLQITAGSPVGLAETIAQYSLYGMAGIAGAVLIALHFARAREVETA